MEHQLNFTLSKELIVTGTRRHWLQLIGWGGLARWAVMSLILIVIPALGYRIFPNWVIALLIASLPVIWAAGYVVLIRRAFGRFDRMQSKEASYRFTEESVESRSDLGKAEIPWRMFDKVRGFADVWLLYVGQRDYVYLPTSAIDEPTKAFIVEQARKHGVKSIKTN